MNKRPRIAGTGAVESRTTPTCGRSRRRPGRAPRRRPPGGSGRRWRWWGGRGRAAPGTCCWRIASMPPVIGSESLKAVRNGRSPLPQRRPGEPVGRRGRVVGPGRHEGGHRPDAGLALLGRERRVVRRPDLVGHPAHAAGRDQPADVEHLGVLDRVAEHPPDLGHVEVAGRESGVGGDDAREPVGVLGHEPQPEQPAPVLAERGSRRAGRGGRGRARASTRRDGRRCGPPARAACPTARSRPCRVRRTGCRRR